jgi:hypothetical protein
MKTTALRWLRRSLVVVAAAAFLTACAEEAPLGPNRIAASPASQLSAATASVTSFNDGNQDVDLGICTELEVPAGHKLAFHVYAKGVQIYHWNGSNWAFDGPSATLFADAEGNSIVGTHSAGPVWESMSGGKVYGYTPKKCVADPNSIPWLLLNAVSDGPGIFERVVFIQRVNTVGGNAPSYAGTVGEEARVPYRTEYLFYRAQ